MDGTYGAVALNCGVEAYELVGRECQQRDDNNCHAPHDNRRHREHQALAPACPVHNN